MKILKFKKVKRNEYLIELEDEAVILYDTIITKYELLLRKKISFEELQRIKKENEIYKNYDLALNYLGKKLRTRKEMEMFLQKQNISEEELSLIISQLEEKGYLNDSQYVDFFIQDKIKFSKDGPFKIKKELELRGIEDWVIENGLNAISKMIWTERIEQIVSKKIDANHHKSSVLLKNSTFQYLIRLGYPSEWLEFLEEKDFLVDEDVLQKEMEKLKKKLSRKYEGEQLYYQIKLKLYQKGFSKENIENILSNEKK